MRTLLLVLAFVASCPAFAACNAVFAVATVRSYHMERRGYNENNRGLGIEYQVGCRDVRLVGGWYDNSINRNSWYAGAVPVWWRRNEWSVGSFIGGISGYSQGNTPIPATFPVLSYEGKAFGANLLMVLPPRYYPIVKDKFKDGEHMKPVFGLQLKWRW